MIRNLDVEHVHPLSQDAAPPTASTEESETATVRRRLEGEVVWPHLGPERRRDVRVDVRLWMLEEADDHICYRRTADVSAGGAFFDPSIPHPLGTRMALRIPLHDGKDEIRAEAEVVNLTDDGEGMGVRFVSFEADGRERLRTFLAALPD